MRVHMMQHEPGGKSIEAAPLANTSEFSPCDKSLTKSRNALEELSEVAQAGCQCKAHRAHVCAIGFEHKVHTRSTLALTVAQTSKRS